MKICLLQLNFHVCDLAGNSRKIIEAVQKLDRKYSIDLFLTSELSVIGYPPKDFLLNRAFVESASRKVVELAQAMRNYPPVVVGGVEPNTSGAGKPLYNAAFLLKGGEVAATVRKKLLPNYDVFDEVRYFENSQNSQTLELNGSKLGVTICEDIWNDSVEAFPLYLHNPLESIRKEKVELIVNIAASPFSLGKQRRREALLSGIALRSRTPIVSVNQVGGSDDLLFSGESCAFDGNGRMIARSKAFEEDFLIVDTKNRDRNRMEATLEEEGTLYKALIFGTRDYIRKCGFQKAVLGLSGGIDSALTATIAAKAIGPENVLGVLMPSPYSVGEV